MRSRAVYKAVWRILSSHMLALWVLGCMVLATLAAGTLPQSARLSPEEKTGWDSEWQTTASWLDSLGLSQIVGSDWFMMLCIILLINITAGTVVSFGRKLAFYRGELKPKYLLQGCGSVPEPPPFLGKPPAEMGVTSHMRGVPGLFGSTLFHLGIAVIVLVGLWRGAIDFSDYIELSEGEVFSGQPGKFQRQQAPPEPFDARLRLDRVEIKIKNGMHVDEFQGHFSYRRRAGDPIQQATVVSNNPLRLGDFYLYPKQSFGYSAWFERLKPDGTFSVLYFHFNVTAKEWEKPWSGEKAYTFYFDDIPHHFSLKLNNVEPPVVNLVVNRDGQPLFKGKLQPGNRADLGAEKLLFRGVVPWMTFNLALDRGVTPLFAGFIITLLGFLLHLLFWPRRVEWRLTDGGWSVRAWVRRGDDAFDDKWNAWCRQQEMKTA